MSEISPYGKLFDKKQQNKDDMPRINNVTFCENYACILYGVFAQFSSKISPLVLYQFIRSIFILLFHEKPKIGRFSSYKKRYNL